MSITTSDETARRSRLRTVIYGRLLTNLLLIAYLATLGVDLVDPAGADLLRTVAAIHLAVNGLALLTPRRSGALAVATEASVLTDAAAIAVLVAVTGGIVSPMAWLVLADAVAVTLVIGWGGGVRAAAMLTIALAWVHSVTPAALPGIIESLGERDPSLALALSPGLRVVWLGLGLWVTTALVGFLNGVAERDLRSWLTDLTMLRQVTHDLDPRLGVDRVCDTLATTMVDRLGYRGAVVWLMRDVRLRPVSEAGALYGDSRALRSSVLITNMTPLPNAVRHDDVTLVRRADPRPKPLQHAHGPNAPLVLLPLRAEGRLLALVSVEVARPLFGSPSLRGSDLRRLHLLADEASLLLDNARLQAELRGMATTDGLTGLPNHRFLQQRLGEEVARVERAADEGTERALSVALFDLDFFKSVNDTYGHPTGDAVLIAIARIVERELHPSAVGCRYGGEEFALVLVDCDSDAARLVCENLADAIRALRLTSVDGRDLGTITASFGVATTHGPRLDRTALIAAADEALYAAKRAGRDRVMHIDDIDDVDDRLATSSTNDT